MVNSCRVCNDFNYDEWLNYLFMLFKCVLKTASMDIDIRVNIYYIICYLYTLQFCMKIKAFI